jgi:ATP-dependent helicase HepA
MSTNLPIKGQRWVSDSEPELGLGIILQTESNQVKVFFPAVSGLRNYALESAPLRRVQFKEGDRIKSHEGEALVVERVEIREGLYVYKTSGRDLLEAELSDTLSFSKPEERLLGGQVDELRIFDMRVEALHRRSEMRKSRIRGFAGGRIDLIPHQMFIAGEVASRLLPRVLLADEVGLGKTIEACLILHRLHLTGRAGRVLILVPEPLVHQWFIELLRRFNLLFSIFDQERCDAILQHDPGANPFLDSQLVICSTGFLAERPARAQEALVAGWDLLIVDEAHHLEWTPGGASPQYSLVEALAKQTPGLLLLTATPEQLGPEGHFARLRLLDPDRYASLDRFLEEAGHYEEVARAVDRLLDGKTPTGDDAKLFGKKSPRIRRHCEELIAGDEVARTRLVSELLDEFGTGRVMFRNTRAALSGFPVRRVVLAPLDQADSKLKWLARLLKAPGNWKVLLICRTSAMAEQIQKDLLREIKIPCGLFHEGLTLLQRDRNAAFFAEEEGARILICSEIGSEGRNFQFVQNLVLFDLPDNPELLEQRIGRLDRIGQTSTIQIHVPYLKGTESEVLARWYHEGLDAFRIIPHGATELAREFADDLAGLKENFDAAALERLIQRTKRQHAKVAKKLERGHDRLLALNSCKPGQAEETIRQIRELDGDLSFEEFLLNLLDHFGVHVEELGNRGYLLHPGNLSTEVFPALPETGMSVTFGRERALSREDLGFLTRDHPLVRGALDLMLGSEAGNAAFGVWKTPGNEAILVEIYALVECIAPEALHADRFLPATPVRVVVDHALKDLSGDPAYAAARLEKGDVMRILDKGVVKKKILPAMIEKALELAGERMRSITEGAKGMMMAQLQDEIERLEDLRVINDHVRQSEIDAAKQEKSELERALATARIRLDAVRLVLRVP